MPYRIRGRSRAAERRDRPLVFIGGAALAAIAGYINVVVLGFFHVPVSHMTGAASRLSIDLARFDFADIRLVFSIVGAFLVGAMVSGVIIGGRTLMPGRRYGVALLTEGVVLAGATALLVAGRSGGVTLAALACGIQNAMASSYYGMILRTTHVTGVVTDIGVMLGHWVRHRRVRAWKLLLLCTILVGFVLGGLIGALAVSWVGAGALGLASLTTLLAGGSYYLWRHSHVRRARMAEAHPGITRSSARPGATAPR